MIKNNFNKELVITKEDDENFESSTRHWIYDNTFVEGYVKLRDQCHITGNVGVLQTEIVILISV